jgi:NADP-dependent 3-hydroxy acid dehydrogenase YdfG
MTMTAVITGASSGIGAATAERLAKDGFEVVLAARRLDRLTALAERIGARALRLDVTDRESVATFANALDRCDVLVNNAGGAIGAEPLAAADPEDLRRSFEVNVLGTLNDTQALLPLQRSAAARAVATIVTVTSTAARVNYEGGGSYSTAKHAEQALVETLRLELCGEPIRVIEVAPGMVHTEEFALNRFRGDSARAAAVYTDVDRPLVAEDIAECIAWTITLPPHVNIDQLVVRPVAQAAQHKVHRGPLFTSRP